MEFQIIGLEIAVFNEFTALHNTLFVNGDVD